MENLKIINIQRFEKETICFNNINDLTEFIKKIEEESTVLLKWQKLDVNYSKLIFTTNILTKIKNNEIELISIENNNGDKK